MKDIPINKLKSLYVNKNFSARKIAKIYECSTATVIKRLREAKIPVKLPYKTVDISKDRLIELYVKKKLSTWKIAEILKTSRSLIHRRLKDMKLIRTRSQSHIIYNRKNFDGNLKEKAYLIGFALGDLRVRKFYKNSETIFVDCASTRIEQVNLFKNLFKEYGKVWIGNPTHKGRIQMQVLLDTSFSFLLDCEKEFYNWVDENPSYFIPFLAGFTDAEGSIFLRKDKNPTFSIGNYNRSLLEEIRKNLAKINLETRKIIQDKYFYTNSEGYKRKGLYCHLNITHRSTILKLFNLLKPYLRHKKRINNMDMAIKSINDKILK